MSRFEFKDKKLVRISYIEFIFYDLTLKTNTILKNLCIEKKFFNK